MGEISWESAGKGSRWFGHLMRREEGCVGKRVMALEF